MRRFARIARASLIFKIRPRRLVDVSKTDLTTELFGTRWDSPIILAPVGSQIKGIDTREDADLCVKYGADGIIVSNHGGRATDTNRATIDSLPEVLQGAAGRIPVLIDGGFRRGTDMFKALALGARAGCVGRPYLWGLAAFGQPGVERVLEILRRELELVMKGSGVRSVREIGPGYVIGARL